MSYTSDLVKLSIEANGLYTGLVANATALTSVVVGNTTSNAALYSNGTLFVSTKIQVSGPHAFDFGSGAQIEIDSSQNTYSQVVIQNGNSGINASGDLVITNDTGNDTVGFIDLGINSSTYNNAAFTITGAGDGYLYASNGALVMGTVSNKDIVFHTNGTLTSNERLRINANGQIVANVIGAQILGPLTESNITPTYTWSGDQTTGMLNPITGQIGFVSTGNVVISIINTTAVGIGSNTTANVIITPTSITALANTANIGSTATLGQASIFVQNVAGKEILSYIGNTGLTNFAQSFIPRKSINYIEPAGFNSTTLSTFGIAVAQTSAITAAALATTNFLTASKGISFSTTAALGITTAITGSNLSFWRGNAAGLGGWLFYSRFGFPAVTVGTRFFVGLQGSTTVQANANPTAQTNIIGIGADTGSANIYIFTANGTANASGATQLGAGAPWGITANNSVYEFIMYAPSNGSTVSYLVNRLDSANTFSGTFTALNLPVNTTTLTPAVWVNSGNNGTISTLKFMQLYIETETQ
jgi:hypothetical protein